MHGRLKVTMTAMGGQYCNQLIWEFLLLLLQDHPFITSFSICAKNVVVEEEVVVKEVEK